jgi:hypothetical protein
MRFLQRWGERNQSHEDDWFAEKRRELLIPTFAQNAKAGHPECKGWESEINPAKMIGLRKSGVSC